MSGVGFWELVLLLLIGLMVLGPERLPRVANQLGSWVGQARRMTRVLKRQLEDELNLEKDLNIRPYRTPQALSHKPEAELPDTYSPAHDEKSPGTGVATSAAEQDSSADVSEERTGGSADLPESDKATSDSNGKT